MVAKSDIDFVLGLGKKLAGLFNGKVSPNHWKGWNELDKKIGAPRGTNAINWVINDGDSVQSEALNIVSYMNATDETGSKGVLYMLGYSEWFKREITVEDIARKLTKGGFPNEAQALLNEAKAAKASQAQSTDIVTRAKAILGEFGLSNPLDALNSTKPSYENTAPVKTASLGKNILWTVGIVLAAVAMFFGFGRKRKRRYSR